MILSPSSRLDSKSLAKDIQNICVAPVTSVGITSFNGPLGMTRSVGKNNRTATVTPAPKPFQYFNFIHFKAFFSKLATVKESVRWSSVVTSLASLFGLIGSLYWWVSINFMNCLLFRVRGPPVHPCGPKALHPSSTICLVVGWYVFNNFRGLISLGSFHGIFWDLSV